MEAPYQLFANGRGITRLSPVPEINLTTLGFVEIRLYYASRIISTDGTLCNRVIAEVIQFWDRFRVGMFAT